MEQTWQQALDRCVSEVERTATRPFAPGVERWLREGGIPKFEENFHHWSKDREQVIKSSGMIGTIADMLTDLEGKAEIGKGAVKDAVDAVKHHCTAGGHQVRYVFCPDLEVKSGNPVLEVPETQSIAFSAGDAQTVIDRSIDVLRKAILDKPDKFFPHGVNSIDITVKVYGLEITFKVSGPGAPSGSAAFAAA